VEEGAIDVGVKRGCVLKQICTISFHRDALCRGAHLQCNAEVHRHRGTYIYILCLRRESLASDTHVIRVEWDIREAEFPSVIRHRASREAADRITQVNGRVTHDSARGINYSADNRSGTT